MRLSKKQKALSLELFGSDRLTRRQFSRAMDEHKAESNAAFDEANDYDILDLVERHTNTPLKRNGQNGYCGPCPIGGCEGEDRFIVNLTDNKAWCRVCNWQYSGLGSGPVGFIASLYNESAYEARDRILGRGKSVKLPKVPITKRTPRVANVRERLDLGEIAQSAQQNLGSDSRLANWARACFTKRGINERALTHFGVGAIVRWGKRFIALPFHSNVDLVCCAVRLRQGDEKKSITGSIFIDTSFGLDAIQGHELAVIVEGEVNALSIWQILDGLGIRADVLSAGSEGALIKSTEQIVRARLKQAKSVIVWADKEVKGHEARAIIERVRPDLAITVLHSQEKVGQKGKIDANDLLLSGHLASVLKHVLPDDLRTSEPSADNAHYEQMKALSSSVTFEQNRLFGQNELDDDREVAESAIKTANSGSFTNARAIARQIKDSQLRRRTIGRIKQLKKTA